MCIRDSLKQVGAQDFLGMKFSAEVTIDLFEEKELGLLNFSLIKGDFRRFEGSWKIQKIKNTENPYYHGDTVKKIIKVLKKLSFLVEMSLSNTKWQKIFLQKNILQYVFL